MTFRSWQVENVETPAVALAAGETLHNRRLIRRCKDNLTGNSHQQVVLVKLADLAVRVVVNIIRLLESDREGGWLAGA